jgi:hypothetical protein
MFLLQNSWFEMRFPCAEDHAHFHSLVLKELKLMALLKGIGCRRRRCPKVARWTATNRRHVVDGETNIRALKYFKLAKGKHCRTVINCSVLPTGLEQLL